MSGHTPGPWTHEWDGFFGPKVKGRKRPEVLVLRDNAGCNDPECCGGPSYSIEVSEPDARLIAAAPELLEAARGLCMWIKHILPEWNSEVQKYLDLTEAAIAKAEGK